MNSANRNEKSALPAKTLGKTQSSYMFFAAKEADSPPVSIAELSSALQDFRGRQKKTRTTCVVACPDLKTAWTLPAAY